MSYFSAGSASILVGAQWGDEGKGKWVDALAKESDIVVRYQGGNNAGHTIWVEGVKHVLHQIPSGVFQKGLISAMAAGVVVHPVGLVDELAKMSHVVAITPDNLWVSARAHVITPWHVYLDSKTESASATPIGTTKRGIGPTYSDKASRSGLRMGHYIDTRLRGAWINDMKLKSQEFKEHFENEANAWEQFSLSAEKIARFVCDVETRLRKSVLAGKKMLLEGAQGTLLDIDHGTYPFVTSSSTASAGACASVGISPKVIGRVIGVAKAYVTRVGSGPFPTELHDAVGALIAKNGHEFGATTGRPRRCGWFDAVAFRYSAAVNGFDGVIINKIDILSGVGDLKICTHYMHPTLGRMDDFPWDAEILKSCVPVYETYQGWDSEIPNSGPKSDLPPPVFAFLAGIEKHTGTKILWVGTGAGRHDMISWGS